VWQVGRYSGRDPVRCGQIVVEAVPGIVAAGGRIVVDLLVMVGELHASGRLANRRLWSRIKMSGIWSLPEDTEGSPPGRPGCGGTRAGPQWRVLFVVVDLKVVVEVGGQSGPGAEPGDL
jgi:hypothetical protein